MINSKDDDPDTGNIDDQESIAGYPAKEILKAPAEPPRPEDTAPPKSPVKVKSHSVASFLMLLGVGVILLGVIFWLANAPAYAVIIAGIGVLASTIGVLSWVAGLYKNRKNKPL